MRYSEKVLAAFTKYEKTADLIRETGLSASTVNKYKNDPELRKIVTERRSEMVSAAVVAMQDYLCEGVEELLKIIRDPENSSQVKINALQLLFNQCRDWMTTTDLQKRLNDVESAISGDLRGQR